MDSSSGVIYSARDGPPSAHYANTWQPLLHGRDGRGPELGFLSLAYALVLSEDVDADSQIVSVPQFEDDVVVIVALEARHKGTLVYHTPGLDLDLVPDPGLDSLESRLEPSPVAL